MFEILEFKLGGCGYPDRWESITTLTRKGYMYLDSLENKHFKNELKRIARNDISFKRISILAQQQKKGGIAPFCLYYPFWLKQ